MAQIGDEIKKARLKNNLSISELSQATSIRSHIIQAIENGEAIGLPDVYIKSFLKKLCEYLEIEELIESSQISEPSGITANPDEEVTIISTKPKVETKPEIIEEKPELPKIEIKTEEAQLKFDDEAPIETPPAAQKPPKATKVDKPKKPKNLLQSNPVIEVSSDYSDIFKKKKVKTGINPNLINYFVYAGVALIIVVVVYFTFFFDSNSFIEKKNQIDNSKDTAQIENDDGLFEYFATSDSLTLMAKSRDTAWLKIEVDGLSSEEILMLPGMERTWTATEFFTVHSGNVGAIKFFRNGEQLELFGKRGSVVKNIKITRQEVLNSSPWKEDPTSEYDAIREVPKETKRYSETNKRKQQERQKLLEPSSLPTQKPAILNDSLKNRNR